MQKRRLVGACCWGPRHRTRVRCAGGALVVLSHRRPVHGRPWRSLKTTHVQPPVPVKHRRPPPSRCRLHPTRAAQPQGTELQFGNTIGIKEPHRLNKALLAERRTSPARPNPRATPLQRRVFAEALARRPSCRVTTDDPRLRPDVCAQGYRRCLFDLVRGTQDHPSATLRSRRPACVATISSTLQTDPETFPSTKLRL